MTKLIQTGRWDVIDFRDFESIATRYLDTCVAVIAYEAPGISGSLGHLTIGSNLEEYVAWLRQTVDAKKSPCFLAGGTSPYSGLYHGNTPLPHGAGYAYSRRNSRALVNELERKLQEANYRIAGRDLYGQKTRDVTLFRDGTLRIEWVEYGSHTMHSMELTPFNLTTFK